MNVALGNFSQQQINAFVNIDGSECDFLTYLESHGLYASRCYLYLMTSMSEEDSEEELNDERLQDINPGFDNVVAQNSPQLPAPEGRAVASPQDWFTICDSTGNVICHPNERDQHQIRITYEKLVESSYSEIIGRYQCFTRAQCLESSSLMDPEVVERTEDYDPLDEGFSVNNIDKGEKCFLRQIFLKDDEEYGSLPSFHFPSAPDPKKKLILHQPTEVWGYDDNQLILAVVASTHMSPSMSYSWLKDGVEIKSGRSCCIHVRAEGKYSVIVNDGETTETSECVHVKHDSKDKIPIFNTAELCEGSSSNPLSARDIGDTTHTPNLPFITKSDFSFRVEDEIGQGTFGTVFKGEWAGTPVAIKRIKVKRPSMIQSAFNSEVRIHCMLRHPNIVQIMAVAMEKRELFIISEFVDGSNLEDLLFSSDEQEGDFSMTEKHSIAKQCAQAVAYLHALKPPVLHRDIKPANVLVSRINNVAKICDMGISKLKAIQTMDQSCVSGIPGTPSYMAPECLLKNEKATVYSDIWSLACTLLEMFTGQECWAIEDQDAETSSNPCSQLKQKFESKEVPALIELLDITIKGILRRCFEYVPTKRPTALQLVNTFKK